MTYRWYDFPKKEVLALLHTDEEKGLDRKEAAARLKEDGKNTVNPVIKAPIRGYLMQVVSDLTALLMLGVALLSLLFRRDAQALVMLILLTLNYAVTIISYVRAQKSLEKLGYGAQPTAKALRGGKVTVIDGESAVQGDILLLSAGDIVPCDCRLLEAEDLYVLEGNLFGNDRATRKDASFERVGRLKSEDAKNLIYASTVILSGRCKAVAVETGPDTLVCKMGKNKPIAACHRLEAIGNLKLFGSSVGALLLLPVFLLTGAALVRGGEIIGIFLASLALAVSAMPELYAAFAYVAVSRGMTSALEEKRRKRKGVFLKNPLALPAIRDLNCLLLPLESMYLENKSMLTEIFDGDRMVDFAEEKPTESDLRVLRYGIISTGLYTAARLIRLNSEGENVYSKEEEALIAAGEKFGVYNKELEERYPILDHRAQGETGSLFETTLVHFRDQDVVVLRGAPHEVLARCTGYVRKGVVHEMNAYARNELSGIAQSLLRENRTPVAVATKTSAYNSLMRIVDAQSDLIFEGFLSIEKPMLPGAAIEIRRLRDAGVRVMAYCAEEGEEQYVRAKALGVVKDENQAVRASDLSEMDETLFTINLKNYTLFEGFGEAQLRFALETLRDEYGMRIGMMGRKLGDVYPMYAVSVGISEEQGSTLGHTGKSGSELHEPVYQRKSAARDGGCQALNYISDVILPPPAENGQGSVHSIASAMRSARFIYRNITLSLIYLLFSGSMRLTALLFAAGGTPALSAVQILTLGLIFDLIAVFVINFDRPENCFSAPFGSGTLMKKIFSMLPAVGLGAVTSALTVLLSDLLAKAGGLSADAREAFCFFGFLMLQYVCLCALLRTGRPFGREFYITPIFAGCTAAVFGWIAASYLIAPFAGLFYAGLPEFRQLLPAFILPLLLGGVCAVTRYMIERSKKKKPPKPKKPKKRKKAEEEPEEMLPDEPW